MDGTDFVKAVISEGQWTIHICNDICRGGIAIRIYTDRAWSLVEAAA
jgi:hypothetical protein